jgi:hypothetical protein
LLGSAYTLSLTNNNVTLNPTVILANRSFTGISVNSTGDAETRPYNLALLPCICAAPTPGVLVENPALPTNLGAVYGIGDALGDTVLGYEAAPNLEIGGERQNVFIGPFVASNSTTSSGNVAIGYEALASGDGLVSNVAIGTNALNLLGLNGAQNKSDNTAVGQGALASLTSGVLNTAIGAAAGNGLNVSTGAVIIGGYTALDLTTASATNVVVLASGANTEAKLILNSSGALSFSTGIQGAAYGATGQVLQSNGPTARPTWVNAGGFQTYPTVRRSTVTTNNTGTYSSVVVNYDVVDVTNIYAYYDVTNGRFTPQQAGFWTIQASARCFDDATLESNVRLVKNGTIQVAICGSYGQVAGNVAATVYFNGQTDYVTVNVTTATAATNSQTSSYFSAFFAGN